MSSFDRRVFLVGLTALAGCGFTPVYGPGGVAEGLRGRIDVVPPSDEEGFALVRRLEDRLGQPSAPDFTLTARIAIGEDAVGFLPDGTISRYNVLGQVDWRLVRTADASLALSGREKSFTSYSATGTTVATLANERDAVERLMIILADQTLTRLTATAGSWAR